MKESIEWHEECLKNRKSHIKELFEEIKRAALLADELKQNVEYCNFYQKQIDKAKQMGKDGFDRDKFLLKRTGR